MLDVTNTPLEALLPTRESDCESFAIVAFDADYAGNVMQAVKEATEHYADTWDFSALLDRWVETVAIKASSSKDPECTEIIHVYKLPFYRKG